MAVTQSGYDMTTWVVIVYKNSIHERNEFEKEQTVTNLLNC